MITLTREEAQRLIDALLAWEEECSGYGWSTNDEECVALLRAKLSEPEPEPVAYLSKSKKNYVVVGQVNWNVGTDDWIPLYTAQPQREWQGLTVDEFYDLDDVGRKMILEYGRLVEAKLKEKNT